jgi:hypothetical protein
MVAVGLAGGIGLGVKAFYERRQLSARADSDGASATAVITAAARELVDPLRRELQAQRAEHLEQLAAERAKYAILRAELNQDLELARDTAHRLRLELIELRQEIARAWEINDLLKGTLVRNGITPPLLETDSTHDQ